MLAVSIRGSRKFAGRPRSSSETVEKAFQMNSGIFLWVLLPFVIWRSSILDHSTKSIDFHETSNLLFGTFSTVSPVMLFLGFSFGMQQFNCKSSIWAWKPRLFLKAIFSLTIGEQESISSSIIPILSWLNNNLPLGFGGTVSCRLWHFSVASPWRQWK